MRSGSQMSFGAYEGEREIRMRYRNNAKSGLRMVRRSRLYATSGYSCNG
jgi:hypothetical protein